MFLVSYFSLFWLPGLFLTNCYSLHSHLSLNSVILYFLGHYFPSSFFIRCLSSDPCLSSILRKKEKIGADVFISPRSAGLCWPRCPIWTTLHTPPTHTHTSASYAGSSTDLTGVANRSRPWDTGRLCLGHKTQSRPTATICLTSPDSPHRDSPGASGPGYSWLRK